MPATVPACGGSKWRSLLIHGRARDMLVRSIKAIVYMTRATGMMRSQRMEMCDGVIFGVAFCPGAVIIRITELPRLSSSNSYWPDKKPADTSGETNVWLTGRMLRYPGRRVNGSKTIGSDSVRCHLPIGYAADLTPVWQARKLERIGM